MEQKSADIFNDKDEDTMRKEESESGHTVIDVKDIVKPNLDSSKYVVQGNLADTKVGEGLPSGKALEDMDASGEVNMEAAILSEDVIRAGGYGARDDIGSFLPVASDSTDFEANLRDARDYEEPQGTICRPGLGWRDTKETK